MNNGAVDITPMVAPEYAGRVIEKRYFDKVALIDADFIKHLVCSEIYKLIQQNYKREEIDIVPFIENELERMFNRFEAKANIWCFSGVSRETFRYESAFTKEYKGNRKVDYTDYDGKIQDMKTVVQHIMKYYHVLIYPKLEADDVVSFLQNENTFIYSGDKDLKQVPGWHFNNTVLNLEYIDEETALKTLFLQMLTGDTVDNISGLPGIGAGKAPKLINEIKTKQLPHKVMYEFQKKFGIVDGTDMFCEMWYMVKMRPARGEHFLTKYRQAFQLRDQLINS